MSLSLPKSIYKELVAHAQSLAPIESCGYLSGTGTTVTTFYPMTNIDNSPEHFTFDPKEQFKVLKEARNKGEGLIAVYHSHPASPARLSEEDIRLFNDSQMVYIIVSLLLDKPDVKAFKVNKESDVVHVESVPIQTI
jgi:proteasome lid subunit RPN8/RPN11